MKTKQRKTGFTPTPICIVGEKEECVQNQSGRQTAKSTASRKLVWGFSLVELLTVMAIIAMLLGILTPALRTVRKIAKDTTQRSQFHGIDVALEMFDGENDGYPISTAKNIAGKLSTTNGAHHLAEALIGRDMLGFDPQTNWDAKKDETILDIYASAKKGSSAAQIQTSVEHRKGPYLASENVEAFQTGQLYANCDLVYDGNVSPSPLLTDTYRIKTVVLSNGKQVKAGTPILYYKADTASQKFPANPYAAEIIDANAKDSIYDSRDNEELIALGYMMDQGEGHQHHFDRLGLAGTIVHTKYKDAADHDGRQVFYKTITNPKMTSQVRPYNMTSYILISAGADGIYGTRDDICNFQ
jgi:prepilin-type N-terminal cleavage/methylation domain-containing protein